MSRQERTSSIEGPLLLAPFVLAPSGDRRRRSAGWLLTQRAIYLPETRIADYDALSPMQAPRLQEAFSDRLRNLSPIAGPAGPQMDAGMFDQFKLRPNQEIALTKSCKSPLINTHLIAGQLLGIDKHQTT